MGDGCGGCRRHERVKTSQRYCCQNAKFKFCSSHLELSDLGQITQRSLPVSSAVKQRHKQHRIVGRIKQGNAQVVLRKGLGHIEHFVRICYGDSNMYGGNSWAGKTRIIRGLLLFTNTKSFMRVHKRKRWGPGEQQREQRHTFRKGKSDWGERTMCEGGRVTGRSCHRHVGREGGARSQKPVKTTLRNLCCSQQSWALPTAVLTWPSGIPVTFFFPPVTLHLFPWGITPSPLD